MEGKPTESSGSGERTISFRHRTGATSDAMRRYDSGCTPLWLQSVVPLGCVLASSAATVKLELLHLTDGIITLGSLQIAVMEKGGASTQKRDGKNIRTKELLKRRAY